MADAPRLRRTASAAAVAAAVVLALLLVPAVGAAAFGADAGSTIDGTVQTQDGTTTDDGTLDNGNESTDDTTEPTDDTTDTVDESTDSDGTDDTVDDGTNDTTDSDADATLDGEETLDGTTENESDGDDLLDAANETTDDSLLENGSTGDATDPADETLQNGTLDANPDDATDGPVDANDTADLEATTTLTAEGAADADAVENATDPTVTELQGLRNATLGNGSTDDDGRLGAVTDGIDAARNATADVLDGDGPPGVDNWTAAVATGTDGEDGGAEDPASDDGADDGDDRIAPVADRAPDPESAGKGAAVGSLLVGGGLLARRFAGLSAHAGGGGGSAPLAAALAWLRGWGWRILGVLGYQRWERSDPLEHDTRATVLERIEADPGVSLSDLQADVDVPMSTLRYHLRILAFEDLIESEKVRGTRRYRPANVEPDPLKPAVEDDATAAVLEAVAAEPDSVSGIADRLEKDPSTVTHHLQRLEDADLIERERDGRAVVNRLADGVDPMEVTGASASHAD